MRVKKTAFVPQECETVILWEWTQMCYYEGDSPIPYYCDEPVGTPIGEYEMCWDDPCDDEQNAWLVQCGGEGTPPEDNGGGGGGVSCDPSITQHLNSIKQAGDSFTTCLEVSEGSLTFDDATSLRSALDDETSSYLSTIDLSDSIKVVMFRTYTVINSGEDLLVKLRRNSLNKWEVVNVMSDSGRNTLAISWTQTNYTVNTSYGIIKVDLDGHRNYNIIFESVGTIWKQSVHYRMNIDDVTGTAISITKL